MILNLTVIIGGAMVFLAASMPVLYIQDTHKEKDPRVECARVDVLPEVKVSPSYPLHRL